jgi:enediyne biosynthesis protein E4
LPTEGASLYVNDGGGLFEDRSSASGLGSLTTGYTGFGTAWFDFDNDGWLDLFTADGSIEAQAARLNDKFPYDERNQLLRNRHDGRFENVSAQAGAVFSQLHVGRGAAFGDIDNDGDTDIVISNMHSPASLLINTIGNRRHWIGMRLVGCGVAGCRVPRDMLGANLQIARPSAPSLRRHARSDGSYASANDPRVLVGLGDSTEAPSVRVTWPNGAIEQFLTMPIDRWVLLKQGEGRAP